MLFNGHSIRLIIIISTLTIFSYPYILQSSQSTISVPTNTNLTTPNNMSLRNITTLIETAAILNQTLANQVEQSQQLSRELRANVTEQIRVVATTFKDLPNSITTILVVAIVLVIAAPRDKDKIKMILDLMTVAAVIAEINVRIQSITLLLET